jgi:hypothetical protein
MVKRGILVFSRKYDYLIIILYCLSFDVCNFLSSFFYVGRGWFGPEQKIRGCANSEK